MNGAGLDQTWKTLSASAVIGTSRHPVAAELLVAPPGSDPEVGLLGALAVVSSQRRAGRVPNSTPIEPPEPPEADSRPLCGPVAAALLASVLTDSQPEMLAHWVDAANRAGLRPPDLLLPDLLDRSTALESGRQALGESVGPLGMWLAGQNDAWTNLLVYDRALRETDDARAFWTSATRPHRFLLLNAIVARDPAFTRELIASTWSSDSAPDRAAGLEAIAASVTAADELFLTTSLTDRSKEVRRIALGLLLRIPGSAAADEARARAQSVVKVARNPLGIVSISVTLPELAESGDARYLEALPVPNLGERARLLCAVVAHTPPDHWLADVRITPDKLISAASGHEFGEALILGWGAATRGLGRDDWSEALLKYWLARDNRRAYPEALRPTIADMPRRGDAFLRDALDAAGGSLDDTSPLHELLQEHPGPWSIELSAAYMRRMLEIPKPTTTARTYYTLSATVKAVGHRMPVEAAKLLDSVAEVESPNRQLAAAVSTLSDTLSLRLKITHALTKEQT